MAWDRLVGGMGQVKRGGVGGVYVSCGVGGGARGRGRGWGWGEQWRSTQQAYIVCTYARVDAPWLSKRQKTCNLKGARMARRLQITPRGDRMLHTSVRPPNC